MFSIKLIFWFYSITSYQSYKSAVINKLPRFFVTIQQLIIT